MKRVILATALAVGSIVFTGRPALAQIQEGWPADGELHWTPSQQEAPAVRPASVVTDPRYNYHHNRWWYFTSDNKLLVWNDGSWQDGTAEGGPVSYTANFRGPMQSTDLSGWYWRDSDKSWYLFDGTTLKLAP